jgi:predicted nucleic acid-binding protein
MKYVLDSSVAIKWVLTEIDSDKALRLRDCFLQKVHQLIAPDIFTSEVAHALTRAERQGRLTAGEALLLWTDVMATAPELFPALPISPRAIEVSSMAKIGVYDCIYVALAEQEGCQLVTADDKLLRTLQLQFPFIIDLKTLP